MEYNSPIYPTNTQVVIEAGIISPLLPLLQDAELFNAAAEVIYNATTKGTNEQINFLVHEGCIEPMCDLLVNPYEAHVIKICLKGLENILKVGEAEKNQVNTEDVNVFAQMIEDAGGLQKITNLKTYDNRKIRRIAVKILVTYWHQEEDNDEDFDDDDGSVMMSTEDEDEEEDDDDDDDDDSDDDDDDEEEDEDEDDSDSKSNTLYSDSKPNIW